MVWRSDYGTFFQPRWQYISSQAFTQNGPLNALPLLTYTHTPSYKHSHHVHLKHNQEVGCLLTETQIYKHHARFQGSDLYGVSNPSSAASTVKFSKDSFIFVKQSYFIPTEIQEKSGLLVSEIRSKHE